MSEERELPKGRLRRLAQLARVGARSGVALVGVADAQAAAEHALQLLGNLRGLAAKIGQMASYVDGFVPEPLSAAYGQVLTKLQAETPRSPFSDVRALVEAELGGALAERFASFDNEPFASASIGQVHRAQLHDGRAVAVKVQHSGIREALEADLSSAGAIASLVAALGPKALAADRAYAEIATRFREELDYALEAHRQEEFRALFADDPDVHIPSVVASHSGERVMTSELCRGLSFEQALVLPEAMRCRHVEVLWRFVFTSIVVHGMFNADPHPGNYLFHEDGRVTFLDFGCLQVLPQSYRMAVAGMHRAALARDERAFAAAARAGLGTVPGEYERTLEGYLYRCFEPLTQSPYRLTRAYVASIVRATQDMKLHFLKKSSNPTPLPDGVLLLNRLQFGFYSVLARFDVEADYAAVDRAILARA